MLSAQGLGVQLHTSRIPLFQGVEEAFAAGVASSLQAGNEQIFADYGLQLDALSAAARERCMALVDPQTSGGFLAAVPASAAPDCLVELVAAGYTAAANIGEVVAAPSVLMELPS